ncbi:MAG TPA: hypothetical protein VFD59_10750 [Nocardioidaceae bacterium]|nr:hypothetical protein [Nocardioidaceae bacterium]
MVASRTPAVQLQHAEDPKQWNRDLERREVFDDIEWWILVVTAKGVYREPERTLANPQGTGGRWWHDRPARYPSTSYPRATPLHELPARYPLHELPVR